MMRCLLLLLTIFLAAEPACAATMIVSSYDGRRLLSYDAATGAALANPPAFADYPANPDGMHIDAQGRLYNNLSNGTVRRYAADLSTFDVIATGGGSFLDLTSNGTHLFMGSFNNRIYRAGLDGSGLQILVSTAFGADGVRIGPDGNLYVVNAGNGTLRKYSTSGASLGAFLPTTGVNGIASQMEFGPDGRIYVSRTIGREARIYRYSRLIPGDVDSNLDPATEQLFGSMNVGTATGIRFGPDGRLYANNYNANSVWRSAVDLDTLGMSLFIADGAGGLDGPGSISFLPVPEPGAQVVTLAIAVLVTSFRGETCRAPVRRGFRTLT